MKDLQTLINHPSVQGGERLHLQTGSPIVLLRGEEKKGMGQSLTSQQLFSLLKASFPPDVIGGLGWGKEAHLTIDAGRPVPCHVQLRPDKNIVIDISLEAPKPAAVAAEDVHQGEAGGDDEVPDTVIEELTNGDNLALIYYKDQNILADLDQVVGDFGYDPRKTTDPLAVNEVIKYTDYPLLILQLDGDFQNDPAYTNLIALNMDRRRTQFSLLVAPGLELGNSLQAFSLSVNMVASPGDMTRLFSILEREVTSWKRFTAAFHELLGDAGRL